MNSCRFCIFSLLFSVKIALACLNGDCRQMVFPAFFHFADKRLMNHDIRNVQVKDVDKCELLCYHEPNCVSINFKTIANDRGTRSCELNNATHRGYDEDFMDTAGYSYRGTESACDYAKCKNGGTCRSGFTDKQYCCFCPSGFTGEECEHDVDECAQNIHTCSTNAMCNNTKGAFNCTCKPGFKGDGYYCADVDECVQNIHNCGSNAVCNNNAGSYNCTCTSGYHGDGRTCRCKLAENGSEFSLKQTFVERNECVTSPNSVCVGGYALGVDCKDIKTRGVSQADVLSWLDPDGGSPSNAFLAYCDMTSYDGGWTMCYTTDDKAKPKIEVTYDASFPYGTDGYRTNCNNIPFTEIIFIDHQTGNKAYFERRTQAPITPTGNYGNAGDAYGLWEGVGTMNSGYAYQLLVCDHSFYTGFFVSGYTSNCYKQCNSWCGDTASPYFRTASTSSSYKGVAFNTNGHHPNVVSNRLMSVGLR